VSSTSGHTPSPGQARRRSIIIPVYNRKGLTRQCVEILLTEPPAEIDREIIVVDDASTDGTPELLASYGDAIRVVRHEENAGFATSCNDGAAAAGGEYLVFLNNDTLPLKGWLDALIRYAGREPKAAVIGCKLLFPDDTVQHAGVAIAEDLNPRHIYAGFPADHPAVNKSRRYPIVTAGCALFCREPFEEAGGFDDAFVNGFEDVDLCLRIGEAGHEVHYCHEAVLYHLEMATRDHADFTANHLLYRRRWAHKVQPDAIQRYVEDGLLKIRFAERYPFFLKVSPLLAVIEEEERTRDADRVLTERSRQVFDLSRENALLKLELAERGGAQAPIDHLAIKRRKQEPKAMYLVSDTPGDPMRYRCDHHAEQLEALGATTEVSRLDQADIGVASLETTSAFVLHRVPISEGVEWFLRAARERDKLVLFDTDDLVFESKAAGDTLDLIAMPEIDRQVLAARLEGHSKAMAMSDAVLVTTEPLAAYARELNPRVHIVPNVASREMVRLADDALAAKTEAPGEPEPRGITISYMSGSPTHDRDFLQAADAVLWALENDTACRFLLVGTLSLDSRFERYRDRITSIPIQPWQRIPRVLVDVDISLAPLEPDNPFTESKSCLKYIEAGLVGVPTIASPRADFVRAIEPGRNGLLAETTDQWQEALGQLLESSELRARLGAAALEDVRARHTTFMHAPRLFKVIVGLTKHHHGRKLTIHWLVDPGSLSVDQASSLVRLVKHLRAAHHTVRLFVNGRAGADSGDRQTVDLGIEALPQRSGAALADLSIASDPESAATIAKRSDALFRLVLIDTAWNGRQLSDRELSNLLELPLRPVCVGDELATRVSALRGMPVDCLSLPLDPAQFEQMLLAECFARVSTLSPQQ
jgi:GT2 family glycosyltransferase